MSIDTPADLEGMRRAGRAVAAVIAETRDAVRAGTPRGELGQSEGTSHGQPADGTAQRMPVRP